MTIEAVCFNCWSTCKWHHCCDVTRSADPSTVQPWPESAHCRGGEKLRLCGLVRMLHCKSHYHSVVEKHQRVAAVHMECWSWAAAVWGPVRCGDQ